MRNGHRLRSSAPLLTLALAATLHAQLLTIPQALARAGKSLSSGPSIPSGPAPTVDRILGDTDIIVRAVVGEPRSYLSEDQMEVLTDYPLRNPAVLYQATVAVSKAPEMPSVIVTILGGTITLNGLSFTSKHEALSSLESDTECLFLLKQVGNQYRIAGTYYGAFRITGTALIPLTKKQSFASELRSVPVTQAAEQMVVRALALHTVGR